jgi:hypothetical protein
MRIALEMKDKGLSWLIIASYFNMTTDTLRKYRKYYERGTSSSEQLEQQHNNICTVIETS